MYSGYKKNKRVVIMVVLREVDTKEVPEVDMGVVTDEDMEEGEVDPPLVSIVERLVMYQGFVPNHVLCGYLLQPQACHRGLSQLIEEVGRKEDTLQHGACRATQK
jgi:hypothetical protein